VRLRDSPSAEQVDADVVEVEQNVESPPWGVLGLMVGS
jgi:hypothetical protein